MEIFNTIKSLSHEDAIKFGLGLFCLSICGDNVFEQALIVLETNGGGCISEMKEIVMFTARILHQDHITFVRNFRERN